MESSTPTDLESYQRKLATILYMDVAGYSRLMGSDEEGTHKRLSDYLDLIAIAILEHGGRVVHYAGDAVLADFAMVSSALNSAVKIQREIAGKNWDLPEGRKVQFRIGINLGEVIVDRGDIFGDDVNIAARLESLADPGGDLHLGIGTFCYRGEAPFHVRVHGRAMGQEYRQAHSNLPCNTESIAGRGAAGAIGFSAIHRRAAI